MDLETYIKHLKCLRVLKTKSESKLENIQNETLAKNYV